MTPQSLLDTARQLNSEAEKNILELGLVLLQINESKAFEQEAATFPQWCIEELGRSKGFVSKLLISATFLKTHAVSPGNLPGLTATKLYTAINSFPEEKPDYILAAATTNTRDEMLEEKRERKNGKDHEHTPKSEDRYAICTCGKWYRV
jgi:hypothetical protein